MNAARPAGAGESAGSMSVSLLMHSTEAQPLFRGAIMQSGALTLIHDRDEPEGGTPLPRRAGREHA